MCKGKHLFLAGVLFVLILMLIGWGEQVQSQEKYPTRAINMLCPFAPGGSVDMTGRLAASYLSKKFGVPVNVINKAGGNTIPAGVELHSAAPDGYTMFNESQASSSCVGIAGQDLSFKVMDRTFIGYISHNSIFVIVPAASPYKSLADLIADCKKDPENFMWGSLGGISGQDIFMRKFFRAIGVDVSKTQPVMFKGASLLVVAAAGGNLKMGSSAFAGARGATQAGTIRMLATTRYRDPEFPDVPTFAELGYPSVDYVNWNGVSGPPKLPSYIVDIWEKAVKEMVNDREFISNLKKIGSNPHYLDSRGMREYIMKEQEELIELWGIKK